ncbi:MAG: hypothetical protein ACXIUD_04480 [Mongoliitalea sp.]
MDLKFRLRFLKLTAYICAILAVVCSGYVFSNSIEALNTPESWRFYAALAGFTIFFSMLILLVMVDLALVIAPKVMDYFKDKLGLT